MSRSPSKRRTVRLTPTRSRDLSNLYQPTDDLRTSHQFDYLSYVRRESLCFLETVEYEKRD